MGQLKFEVKVFDENDVELSAIKFSEDPGQDLTIEIDYFKDNQTLEHVGTRPRDRQ